MPDTDQWLTRYERNNRDIRLPLVYWLAAPLLVLGFVGLLWALPIPAEFRRISPLLNWGSAFLMATLIYYFIISVPLALGMLPFIVGVMALEMWLAASDNWLRPVAAGLTLAGLAGLVAGHASRGGLRAVFRDVQLLMIAPLWLLSVVYRRLGIPL